MTVVQKIVCCWKLQVVVEALGPVKNEPIQRPKTKYYGITSTVANAAAAAADTWTTVREVVVQWENRQCRASSDAWCWLLQ